MDWDALISLIISLFQLAAVIVTLILLTVFLIKTTKKQTSRKAQELARIQWEQENKAQAARNSLNWICKSCGNANHNREVCEVCGSVKRV